jgi:hypothetical protein
MNRTVKILIIILVFLIGAAFVIYSKVKNEKQRRPGEYVITGSGGGVGKGSHVWNKREFRGTTANGEKIEVKIILKAKMFKKEIHGKYWGVYANHESIPIIESFDVVIGKKTIPIPASACSDLATIRDNVDLEVLKDECKIRLFGGGDAGGH